MKKFFLVLFVALISCTAFAYNYETEADDDVIYDVQATDENGYGDSVWLIDQENEVTYCIVMLSEDDAVELMETLAEWDDETIALFLQELEWEAEEDDEGTEFYITYDSEE